MRTTIALDDDLVLEAQRLTGTSENALVRLARSHPCVIGEPALGHLSRRSSP